MITPTQNINEVAEVKLKFNLQSEVQENITELETLEA
jgi:hypothetical protein